MQEGFKKRIAIASSVVLCFCAYAAVKFFDTPKPRQLHQAILVNVHNNIANAHLFYTKYSPDTVYIKCIFKNAGVFHNQPGKHGVSSVVASLLFKRISGLSPNETVEKLHELGIRQLAVYPNHDHLEISFFVDQKNAKEALAFLNTAFVQYDFSEGDLDVAKNSLPTVLNPETASSDTLVIRKLYEMLYKNSNYGLSTVGTSQDITSLTLSDIRNFIKEKLTRKNLEIFMVGDLSANDVNNYLEIFLANIANGTQNPPMTISNKISQEKITKITKENMRDIITVAHGIRIDPLSAIDKAAFLIAKKMIFDDHYSDFNEALEQAKIACNFYTQFSDRDLSNTFFIVAEIDEKDLKKYLKCIDLQIRKIRQPEFTERNSEKLLATKECFMKAFSGGFSNISDIDEQAKNTYLPFDKIRLENIAAVLRKVFMSEQRTAICSSGSEAH